MIKNVRILKFFEYHFRLRQAKLSKKYFSDATLGCSCTLNFVFDVIFQNVLLIVLVRRRNLMEKGHQWP